MKKLLVTFFYVLAITNLVQAQIKSIKLLDQNIGQVHLIYQKIIDLDKGDTLYMVYMGFQNARYSTLTDIKSIALSTTEMMEEFKKDLSGANKQMQSGEKVSMRWDRKEYQIQLHEFTKECSLGDGDGRGYTWLNLKQINKLINGLNRIQFGQDQLLVESK